MHTGDFRCPYLTLEELLALRSGKLKAAEAAERMAGRDLDWPLELSASISPELKQLIQGLLHKDPLHRAGGEQVRAANGRGGVVRSGLGGRKKGAVTVSDMSQLCRTSNGCPSL